MPLYRVTFDGHEPVYQRADSQNAAVVAVEARIGRYWGSRIRVVQQVVPYVPLPMNPHGPIDGPDGYREA